MGCNLPNDLGLDNRLDPSGEMFQLPRLVGGAFFWNFVLQRASPNCAYGHEFSEHPPQCPPTSQARQRGQVAYRPGCRVLRADMCEQSRR